MNITTSDTEKTSPANKAGNVNTVRNTILKVEDSSVNECNTWISPIIIKGKASIATKDNVMGLPWQCEDFPNNQGKRHSGLLKIFSSPDN